jgi:hypothetical protein
MSTLEKVFTNAATVRLFATIVESSNQTLEDGRPFSMAIYDEWDEQEQRAFMVEFMLQRWDSLTPQQQMEETIGMTPVCHLCGSSADGINFAPDASVGNTRLFCSDCALKAVLRG